MNLKGKKILLTGASGGIGQALAQQLSAQGAELFLVGRSEQRLQALQAQLHSTGGTAHCLQADLTRHEDCQYIAQQQNYDLLINNAGQMYFGAFAEMSAEQLDSLYQTNLLAPLQLIREMLPSLSQRPEAMIVNIGSIFGSLGFGFFSAYCGSKFGLRGFSEALRRELHDSNVQVLYAAPRAVATRLNDEKTQAFNEANHAHVDTPKAVATHIIRGIQRNQKELLIGQPESFFARLNQWFPRLIDRTLIKTMRLAKKHA